MDVRSEHNQLIRESPLFHVDVNAAIFPEEEFNVLRKYGYWYAALTDGKLTPLNQNHHDFIACAQGKRKPSTVHELAWCRYLGRKKLESESPEKFGLNYQNKEEGFYTGEHYKQMKSMMGSEMNKNHRK